MYDARLPADPQHIMISRHQGFSNTSVETDEEHLLDSSTRVVHALINAMEAKSPFLRGHSHRVGALAATLAAELQMPDDMVEAVRLAGQLMDIGKIGVREAVLDKPEQLTAEEFAHVQEHVAIGLNILAPLREVGPIHDFIAHHHERIDGSGYPAHLTGDAVSLGGRLLGAADAFDALTSPRAYRDAMTSEEALATLKSLGPRGICPTVLPALERVVRGSRVLVFINDTD